MLQQRYLSFLKPGNKPSCINKRLCCLLQTEQQQVFFNLNSLFSIQSILTKLYALKPEVMHKLEHKLFLDPSRCEWPEVMLSDVNVEDQKGDDKS